MPVPLPVPRRHSMLSASVSSTAAVPTDVPRRPSDLTQGSPVGPTDRHLLPPRPTPAWARSHLGPLPLRPTPTSAVCRADLSTDTQPIRQRCRPLPSAVLLNVSSPTAAAASVPRRGGAAVPDGAALRGLLRRRRHAAQVWQLRQLYDRSSGRRVSASAHAWPPRTLISSRAGRAFGPRTRLSRWWPLVGALARGWAVPRWADPAFTLAAACWADRPSQALRTYALLSHCALAAALLPTHAA